MQEIEKKHIFNPLMTLQQTAMDAVKKNMMNSKQAEFDAIWVFTISGTRFEQITNPL